MRRSKSLRVSVAIGLILTLVLVNRHVASIEPAQAGDSNSNFKSEFVIEDGEGHIELVSVDRYPRAIVDSARAASSHTPIPPPASILQTIAKPAPSPTVQAWPEPTKPAPPTRFAPKQIPVNVPGEFSWDDDDSSLEDYGEEEVQLGQRYKNSKPTSSSPRKPKPTPKSDRIIVLGRMSYEDATWLEDELPE